MRVVYLILNFVDLRFQFLLIFCSQWKLIWKLIRSCIQLFLQLVNARCIVFAAFVKIKFQLTNLLLQGK